MEEAVEPEVQAELQRLRHDVDVLSGIIAGLVSVGMWSHEALEQLTAASNAPPQGLSLAVLMKAAAEKSVALQKNVYSNLQAVPGLPPPPRG